MTQKDGLWHRVIGSGNRLMHVHLSTASATTSILSLSFQFYSHSTPTKYFEMTPGSGVRIQLIVCHEILMSGLNMHHLRADERPDGS